MKNIKRTLGAITVTTSILATSLSPVFAQVTNYVTDKEGVKYEYNKEELEDSILESIEGGEAKLYNRYLTETLMSLKDDKNGYIDLEDVEEYILNAITAGEAFNVDDYTESEDAKVIEIKDVVIIDKDGNEINEEEEGLKVVEVSAINANYVTVAITAPAEDMLAQEVEVKNSVGTVVAVKPLDIAEGDETAEFEFVTVVKAADLVGVWTVNGQSYDLDLFNNLSDLLEADSQIKLNAALVALKIENVNSANMPAYKTAQEALALDKTAGELTVADVQKMVDDVNAKSVDKDEEKAIAKAIEEAFKAPINEIALLEALQNPVFVRVNPEWLNETTNGYKTTLAGVTEAADTIISIQTLINNSNDAIIKAKQVTTGIDKAKLNATQALIDAYGTVDKDGKLTHADVKTYPALIKIQLAVVEVVTATTPTALKAKVTALATLVDNPTNLDIKTYIDANAKEYIAVIKDLNSEDVQLTPGDYTVTGKVDEVAEIKTLIAKVNLNESAGLVGAVKIAADAVVVADNATTQDALIKALNNLGLKQVSVENKAVYGASGAAFVTASTTPKLKKDVQVQLDTSNLAAVAAASKTTILDKLNVFGLDNIVVANAEDYFNAASTIGGVTPDANGDNAETVKLVKAEVAIVNKAVTVAAEVKAINEAETVAEVKAALDALVNAKETKVDGYLTVRSADRDFVAAHVLTKRADATLEVYDIDTLKTELDLGVVAHGAALTDINNIEVDTAINAIVDALDATLDEDFVKLDPADKVIAAEAFYDKLVFGEDGSLKTPFVTLSAAKDLL